MRNQAIYIFLLFITLALSHSTMAQSFGGSAAIAGGDILVGETGNVAHPGEIYVFSKVDEQWTTKQKLTLESGQRGDRFGSAMVYGNNQLIVGASALSEKAGGIFLFEKDGDSWMDAGQVMPGVSNAGDRFGHALALSGNRLAVSAHGAGAIFIYEKGEQSGKWELMSTIEGSEEYIEDGFGANIALNENLLIISAPQHDSTRGAAYVYRYDDTAKTWNEAAKLMPGDLPKRSGFGSAITFFGGKAFIGAPNTNQRSGSVFSFSYDDASDRWVQSQELKPFDGGRFARFGSTLTTHDNTLWIASPGYARAQGAIYIYEADSEGDWANVAKMKGNEPGARASFGASILVSDDLAVIGATSLDSRSGAAMVFSNNDASQRWDFEEKLINEMKSFPEITGREVKCENDRAGEYSCKNVDMLSFIPIKDIGGERGVRLNDIWGWKDDETNKEYALVGRSNGTSFVDVTDPYHPIYIGDLPKTEGSRSNVWRDIKVYENHAFIVADGAGEHGMQVFDLTLLRNTSNLPVTFEATAHYDRIASAHNVVINESTGYAYIVGSSGGGESCGGGLHMVNIQNPSEPTFSGCFADTETGRRGTGYSHDAQCVIYQGPDVEHRGKEICFGSNETALSIADVSDKDNPIALSMMSYPRVAYSHQGWLTEDHRYFYMNDEGDEVTGLVSNTRTLVWDVVDLDDPILVKEHFAETTAMDHNLYIKGNLMYQSNYDAGFRILDISEPENPVEVGFFDTTPFEGTGGGSWSNYPYFESGAVIVSSSYEGLFILKKGDIVF